MRSVRLRLLAACLLLIVSAAPIHAAGPSIIMISGGPLREPIFVVQKNLDTYAFLWCGRAQGISKAHEDRPFLHLAIFWIADVWRDPDLAKTLLPTLKPENAHQHGRLYLPRGDVGARVVTTSIPRNPANGPARALPTSVDEFVTGCSLTAKDLEAARAARIPGL